MRKKYEECGFLAKLLLELELKEKYKALEKNVQQLAEDYLNSNNKKDDLHKRSYQSIVSIVTNEAEAFIVSKTFKGFETMAEFEVFKVDFVREVLERLESYTFSKDDLHFIKYIKL